MPLPRLPSIEPSLAAALRRLRELLRALARSTRAGAAALVRAAAGALQAVAAHPAVRSAARVLALTSLAAGALLAFAALCVVRVRPGEVGVRRVHLGPGGGIVQRDHGPGLYLGWPLRERWTRLRAGTHFVRFSWESEGGDEPILAVATGEGEPIEVAVSVPFQIAPGAAWRLVAAGLEHDYRKRAVAVARRVLLEELARLSSDAFADPDARAAVAAAALERLRGELEETHLVPQAVWIGSTFFHPALELKMLEKQVALQGELTNRSLAALAAARLERKRSEHELELGLRAIRTRHAMRSAEQRVALEAEVEAVVRRTGERSQRLRFEGDAACERLVAEGERALAEAEALAERLRGEVLGTGGGRLHLALEAARNLRFGSVTLDAAAAPSPLQLDRLVELLVGAQRGE